MGIMTKTMGIATLGVAFLVLVCVSGLELHKTSDRTYGVASLPILRQIVSQKTRFLDTPEQIIDACADISTSNLSFSRKNNLDQGTANCIGYAQHTAALLNMAFREKGMPYRARPVVGVVTLFGLDLCKLSQSSLPQDMRAFFKDHDWVEVSGEDRRWYVDSSLRDLTWRGFVMEVP